MSWLQEKKENAIEKFETLPDPKFKYGISLYNNMKELDLSKFNTFGKEEITVEGDATILDFTNLGVHEKTVQEYLFKTFSVDDKLTALHVAFLKKGILIYVPDEKELEKPIKITHNLKKGFSSTHVLVVAGRNSKCTIIESELGGGFLKSSGVEIFAKESSHVDYVTLQNLAKDTWHFSIKRCFAEKEANVNWFTASFGSKQSKIEISTDLVGEGSKTKNLGVFIGDKDQVLDIYNSAIHSAPHTYSDMDNKGIVKDKAKSIYRGLVKIKEKSHDCVGYQKQDTLMLSKDAKADAIPNLEIDNNDVRCSHGATMGQVDDDKLFYMMSRGLTKAEAENEIIRGFLGAMIDRSPEKKAILEAMQEKL